MMVSGARHFRAQRMDAMKLVTSAQRKHHADSKVISYLVSPVSFSSLSTQQRALLRIEQRNPHSLSGMQIF